jgi:hypothetical protein
MLRDIEDECLKCIERVHREVSVLMSDRTNDTERIMRLLGKNVRSAEEHVNKLKDSLRLEVIAQTREQLATIDERAVNELGVYDKKAEKALAKLESTLEEISGVYAKVNERLAEVSVISQAVETSISSAIQQGIQEAERSRLRLEAKMNASLAESEAKFENIIGSLNASHKAMEMRYKGRIDEMIGSLVEDVESKGAKLEKAKKQLETLEQSIGDSIINTEKLVAQVSNANPISSRKVFINGTRNN